MTEIETLYRNQEALLPKKRRFAKDLQPEIISEKPIVDGITLRLIEAVKNIQPNGQFPVWTKELTDHLDRLDNARYKYGCILYSLRCENRSRYNNATLQEMITIAKQSSEFRELYSYKDPIPIDPKDSFNNTENIRKDIIDGKESYPIILLHAKIWVLKLLEESRVIITPETESFIQRVADDIARVLKLGDQFDFPAVVKERIKKELKESDINIHFREFKQGSLRAKVSELAVLNLNLDQICEKLPQYTRSQVSDTIADLRRIGILKKLTDEEKKIMRSEVLKRLSKERDFQEKKLKALREMSKTEEYSRKQRVAHMGKRLSPETRVKISTARNGRLHKIQLLRNLSPYITAELIGDPDSEEIRKCICSQRKTEGIVLSKEEKRERAKRAHRQSYIDRTIKKLFGKSSSQKEAYIKSLPFAQRATSDLLEEFYSTNLLTPRTKRRVG